MIICQFSPNRKYRYTWRAPTAAFGVGSLLCFVLLNPSTADEMRADPTVSRCLARATRLGFGEIVVVNLFAWRSTDPKMLPRVSDPVGPANNHWILAAAADASMVICGWGNDGNLHDRGRYVLGLLRGAGHQPHALKINADGTPAHPLYLPYSLQPFPLEAA